MQTIENQRIMHRSAQHVSVVMCTYNGEKHLREQLDSLLAQTFPIHEIVVQDDGSTDTTWAILSAYAAKYTHIKLFRNQSNLGLNQNFLSAFNKATGEYIAVSDQDDVWKPEKIDTCMNEFASGNYTLVYTDSYITDEKLTVQYATNFTHFSLDDVVWMGVAPGHSMVFKRAILEKIKNFDQIDFIYDWLLNLVAVASGNVKKTQQPLTYWRKHTSNVTDPQYVPPAVIYQKPLALTASVFRSLLGRRPMKNFKWQFDNIYLILKNFDDNPMQKPVIRFLQLYKQETPIGFLAASFAYMRSRNDASLAEKLKSMYIPVYRYYFYKRDGAGLRGK